jgi:hypothetical protein
VASDAAMGALFVGLMTTYLAYLLAVIVSLALLLVYHAVSISHQHVQGSRPLGCQAPC